MKEYVDSLTEVKNIMKFEKLNLFWCPVAGTIENLCYQRLLQSSFYCLDGLEIVGEVAQSKKDAISLAVKQAQLVALSAKDLLEVFAMDNRSDIEGICEVLSCMCTTAITLLQRESGIYELGH